MFSDHQDRAEGSQDNRALAGELYPMSCVHAMWSIEAEPLVSGDFGAHRSPSAQARSPEPLQSSDQSSRLE
jgi:hypothetical protein